MPSDRSWTGDASGDPATAGNYTGGVAVITGDTLRFNQGDVSISTNEDALAGVTLALLTRNGGYLGVWGDNDDPFTVSAARLEYASANGISGEDYLAGAFNVISIAATGGRRLNLLVTGDTQIEAMGGDIRIMDGSEYGHLLVGRATVEIGATAVQAADKRVFFSQNGEVVAYGEIQNASGEAGKLTLRGDGAGLAGTAITGSMKLHIETTGAVNEVWNAVPGKQGVVTEKAFEGVNIATYIKHKQAYDDFSGSDDGRVSVGTVIEIGSVNSTVEA